MGDITNFTCPRCSYATTAKRYLLSHLRTVRPCEPKDCNQSREDILAELLPKRNNDEPFRCMYCDMCFNTKQSRSRHQLHYCKQRHVLEQQHNEVDALRQLVESLSQEITNLKNQVVHSPSSNVLSSEGNDNMHPLKKQKAKIPQAKRIACWNRYIGEEIGKTKCICCRLIDITTFNFHCGHVVA